MVINGKAINVEVAATADQRELGLMHRKNLPENSGMIFLYPEETPVRFWMKDTLIPLSIAFIKEDGTITQIADMKPLTEDTTWSRVAVKYALEMNKGWFKRNNIKEGDKVFIPDSIKKIKSD
ncbi:MAG: DUF192 domain-containing protein [Planctomycetes bacterium]|nr:DUF192 domain-containing protein [Planctomycetota bacterium]